MAILRRIQKNSKSIYVTIPAELRDALDLQFGDTLAFVLWSEGWGAFCKIDVEKRPDLKEFLPEGLPKINYD